MLNNHPIPAGTFTLTLSSVSVCPDEMVTLSCSSTGNTITSHGWFIRVPGCDELTLSVSDLTPTHSKGAVGTSTCPMVIHFQAKVNSSSPLVSRLTTTTAPDGTIINCGNIAGTSPDVIITVKGNWLLWKCV